MAIRARVPIEVLRDTIQPFPTFSEIYVEALKSLRDADRGHAAASGNGGEMNAMPVVADPSQPQPREEPW